MGMALGVLAGWSGVAVLAGTLIGRICRAADDEDAHRHRTGRPGFAAGRSADQSLDEAAVLS